MTTPEKIDALAALITEQTLKFQIAKGYATQAERNSETFVRPGKKYVKVDRGTSAFLMVEPATEKIFGCKGYGVIHRGKCYGTLDTINDWYWGDYHPRLVEGSNQ